MIESWTTIILNHFSSYPPDLGQIKRWLSWFYIKKFQQNKINPKLYHKGVAFLFPFYQINEIDGILLVEFLQFFEHSLWCPNTIHQDWNTKWSQIPCLHSTLSRRRKTKRMENVNDQHGLKLYLCQHSLLN